MSRPSGNLQRQRSLRPRELSPKAADDSDVGRAPRARRAHAEHADVVQEDDDASPALPAQQRRASVRRASFARAPSIRGATPNDPTKLQPRRKSVTRAVFDGRRSSDGGRRGSQNLEELMGVSVAPPSLPPPDETRPQSMAQSTTLSTFAEFKMKRMSTRTHILHRRRSAEITLSGAMRATFTGMMAGTGVPTAASQPPGTSPAKAERRASGSARFARRSSRAAPGVYGAARVTCYRRFR